ncbi:MAG TPA: c-type cytochrome [Chitinophagaceae bacterium]|nr:c-type cytochrome [Chitinophagaceae bacterium]
MRKTAIAAGILAAFICIASFNFKSPANVLKALNDSLEADRQKYTAIVTQMIKGREKMKVDSVFKNLKVLGGFPAENLVFAMNAWSRGLGVSCGHCHNTSDFSSDEKEKKEIARQMVTMGNMISQHLKTIKGLSDRPIVNCITCHRGELKPAFRMPVGSKSP